jgi:predicted nucleotidyltransferase
VIESRDAAVDEVVRRLVEHCKPERIYLFGSSARGEARPDSDLDFLVVLPDDAPRESLFDGSVYQRLWNIPCFLHRKRVNGFGWQHGISGWPN